ncbi:MAG: hypothetical protein Q4A55_06645 [Aerococcus sp.]|nr:hypothetical protein [Aerococcus sp.]
MAKKKPKEITFSKEEVRQSNAFTPVERDFLVAYLADDETYTIDQAKKILEKQLKGAVK